MNKQFNEIKAVVVYKAQQTKARVEAGVKHYWPRLVLVGIAAFLLTQKDFSMNLSLNAVEVSSIAETSSLNFWSSEEKAEVAYDEIRPMNTSLIQKSTQQAPKKRSKSHQKRDDNLANTFSNLDFEGSEKAKKRAAKRKKQLQYVKQYKQIAIAEMERYGIPASITLAQGLLESNVGESKLAKRNLNHFGIKCFSRKCKKGHCSNFTDDSHKDFFRIYKSEKESYRAHSLLLKNGKRYNKLFRLQPTDYRGWAKGLSKAGYATDKRYAQKIIGLIEDLDLDQYDD
ncbi:MAG: glucosaminidase domain-containing protein [Bacteroidota bacterium]